MEDAPEPRPLTEREQAIWDLKELGNLTHKQIGEQLGLSTGNIDQTLHKIRNKQEGKPGNTPRGGHGKAWSALDKTRPDEWAQLFDSLTNPMTKSVAQAARESGVSVEAAKALAKKLETGVMAPVAMQVAAVKTEVLRDAASGWADRILNSITKEDIEDASLYQKVIAFAALVDKTLLLSGRPTEIIQIQDYDNVVQELRDIMEVVEYREMTIDVSPVDPTGIPTVSSAVPYNPHAERPVA